MTVVFITQSAPYGRSEAFAIAEIKALRDRGMDVRTVPVRPDRSIYHADADALAATTVRADLLGLPVLGSAVVEIAFHPRAILACARLLLQSRTASHLVKNLLVVPKALWLARWMRRRGVSHVHAFWATTPATVAAMVSAMTGVPFSFTAHAWDIGEDNLLSAKVRDASWVRTVADAGRSAVLDIVGPVGAHRITTIHLGVDVPPHPAPPSHRPDFVFVTVASLERRKGHLHLLTALRRLRREHPEILVRLVLIGDGPLRPSLEHQARLLGVAHDVEFRGAVPHQVLLASMDAGAFDAMVLPSADGGAEGIPVALMEAMARGLPVIATDSGGTAELVAGAGLLTRQGDAGALANAMHRLAGEARTRSRLGRVARSKVLAEFDVARTAGRFAAALVS